MTDNSAHIEKALTPEEISKYQNAAEKDKAEVKAKNDSKDNGSFTATADANKTFDSSDTLKSSNINMKQPPKIKGKQYTIDTGKVNNTMPKVNLGLNIVNSGLKGLKNTADAFANLGKVGLNLDSSGIGTMDKMTSVAQQASHIPDQTAKDTANALKEYRNDSYNSRQIGRKTDGIKMYNEMIDAEKKIKEDMKYDRTGNLTPDQIREYNTKVNDARNDIAKRYGIDPDRLNDADPASKYYQMHVKDSKKKLTTDAKYTRHDLDRKAQMERLDETEKRLNSYSEKRRFNDAKEKYALVEEALYNGSYKAKEYQDMIRELKNTKFTIDVGNGNVRTVRPFPSHIFDPKKLIIGGNSDLYLDMIRYLNTNGYHFTKDDFITDGNTMTSYPKRNVINAFMSSTSHITNDDGETQMVGNFSVNDIRRTLGTIEHSRAYNQAEVDANSYNDRIYDFGLNKIVGSNGETVGFNIPDVLVNILSDRVNKNNISSINRLKDVVYNWNKNTDNEAKIKDLVNTVDPKNASKAIKALNKMKSELDMAYEDSDDISTKDQIMSSLKEINELIFIFGEKAKLNIPIPNKRVLTDDNGNIQYMGKVYSIRDSNGIVKEQPFLKWSDVESIANKRGITPQEFAKELMSQYGYKQMDYKKADDTSERAFYAPKKYKQLDNDEAVRIYQTELNKVHEIFRNGAIADIAKAMKENTTDLSLFNFMNQKNSTDIIYNRPPSYPGYYEYRKELKKFDRLYGTHLHNSNFTDVFKETHSLEELQALENRVYMDRITYALENNTAPTYTSANYGSPQDLVNAISSGITAALTNPTLMQNFAQLSAQSFMQATPQTAAFTSLYQWAHFSKLDNDTIYRYLNEDWAIAKLGIYGDILKNNIGNEEISKCILVDTDFANANTQFEKYSGLKSGDVVPGDPILWLSTGNYSNTLTHACNAVSNLNNDDDKIRGTKVILRNMAFALAGRNKGYKQYIASDEYRSNVHDREMAELFTYLANRKLDEPIAMRYKNTIEHLIRTELVKFGSKTAANGVKFNPIYDLMINQGMLPRLFE